MSKKPDRDVLTIINNFQKIIDQKPPMAKMLEEVQMMKFKVHPVQGDITDLNLNNEKLLETVWSLGKLDELFQKEYDKLSKAEKNVFIRMFDGLYQRFQSQLSNVNYKQTKSTNTSPVLEMEIFRERQSLKRVN